MTSDLDRVPVNIVCYDGAMRSAIYGMVDLFSLAARFGAGCHFDVRLIESNEDVLVEERALWLLPPCFSDPLPDFSAVMPTAHFDGILQKGGVVAACCASTFILAHAGLLSGRRVTTHWAICHRLRSEFPLIESVVSEEMLIDEGAVVTAAGLFAYQDLVLHFIARYAGYTCAKSVADFSLLDFGSRAQAFYQRFIPDKSHGDKVVLEAQQVCESGVGKRLSIATIAAKCCVTEKTLSRRFQHVLKMAPKRYYDELVTEKARQLLDARQLSVQEVAYQLGFDDVSNFTRLFKRISGLSPAEYASRC
ncbi:GlxA family transcriptional regulator [Thaumasiovibrio subtropicus]|uniref:GlxA family transcriptional regulator n=1 Tax=Thaumasiovibrio subtropicus TaxID=1891207 RepID=UPI00131E2940|nr:helix-turn-helix domain-containing protein [Thaumasiovibrio subtropicus]